MPVNRGLHPGHIYPPMHDAFVTITPGGTNLLPLVLTTMSEVYFGGIRLDPGTYEVRRVSEKPDDSF